MAKLSAHGREVARVVTSRTHKSERFDPDQDAWVEFDARDEYHYSFRSDGHVLRRIVGLDVHPGESDPSRQRHDFGWKLHRKGDPARMLPAAQALAQAAFERGGLVSVDGITDPADYDENAEFQRIID